MVQEKRKGFYCLLCELFYKDTTLDREFILHRKREKSFPFIKIQKSVCLIQILSTTQLEKNWFSSWFCGTQIRRIRYNVFLWKRRSYYGYSSSYSVNITKQKMIVKAHANFAIFKCYRNGLVSCSVTRRYLLIQK